MHKKTVVVDVITPEVREARTFGTMTDHLLELVEWLESHGVVDVAMNSTGVYWKPLYNLLEAAGMKPVVANARHIKAVPGRKTDVCDAEWIVELHRHGIAVRSRKSVSSTTATAGSSISRSAIPSGSQRPASSLPLGAREIPTTTPSPSPPSARTKPR